MSAPLMSGISLILALAFKGIIIVVEGNRQSVPTLVGSSEEGTRYYIQLHPEGKVTTTETEEGYAANDGFICHRYRLYQKKVKSEQRAHIYIYTMDDVKGFKVYSASASAAWQTRSGAVLFELRHAEADASVQSDEPIVSAANRLCLENDLLLAGEEEPAPNGVYYGFNEDGLRAMVKFDRMSRVSHIKVDGPLRLAYNEFLYTTVGKAIHASFGVQESSDSTVLILEPVDPHHFNGTRDSFTQARINTVAGRPFDSDRLSSMLGLNKARTDSRSRPVHRLTAMANAASRLRANHRLHRRDSSRDELLAEHGTEEAEFV
ncbi:hypothetical protein FOZ61_007307 [Perkinsus olseni]|uniref:Uncharacterized protein n=1 Tax=Perkinsus olseni TaxID=32597 RepID=A0A7J6MPW2_PEROL|nr:hypothetical protein FOZ61_007307 [Perkinsus olseni]KAF4673612.1 hypothetical protein FOL46_006836 [Perkinsus olseni]